MKSKEQPGNGKTLSQATWSGCVYQFGPFELDPGRYELRRHNLRLRLPPAPMDLLLLLVERRNYLVNRDEISARLWPDPSMVDVDQGINSAIRRVREALRDDPAKPRFIETVVGKGYRFVAEVEQVTRENIVPDVAVATKLLPGFVSGAAPSVPLPGPAETAHPDTQQPQIERRLTRPGLGFLSAAILLLLLGATFLVWRHRKQQVLHPAASLAQVTTNDSELRVTAAAISPDGKWIVYADLKGVYLLQLESETTVSLPEPKEFRVERIAWFPDQTRVLVSGFVIPSAEFQIWTTFVTGGAPFLVRKDARNGIPSPDGARIAFTANKDTELWIAGTAGENARSLVVERNGRALSSVFWAGGGQRLSYLRSLNRLGHDDYESADANSGSILASKKDFNFDSAAAAENGRIVFLRDSLPHYGTGYGLWEVKTDPSTGALAASPTQLAALDEGKASELTASADGSRISLLLEKGHPHVFVGTLHQPGPTLADVQRLTFDIRTDFPGSWLHDNQTVLFESDRRRLYQLYKQQLHDSSPQRFNTGEGTAVLPQVTPDGKWILYAAYPEVVGSNDRKLFRMASGGSAPEQVAIGGPLDEFRCPVLGGSTCVLRRTESDKFFVYYVLDAVTGKGRELARTSWLPHVTSDWCVAPDRSAVALTSHDTSNPRFRIVPLAGNPKERERELTVSGFGMLSGISWSADGKGWYVAADTPPELPSFT